MQTILRTRPQTTQIPTSVGINLGDGLAFLPEHGTDYTRAGLMERGYRGTLRHRGDPWMPLGISTTFSAGRMVEWAAKLIRHPMTRQLAPHLFCNSLPTPDAVKNGTVESEVWEAVERHVNGAFAIWEIPQRDPQDRFTTLQKGGRLTVGGVSIYRVDSSATFRLSTMTMPWTVAAELLSLFLADAFVGDMVYGTEPHPYRAYRRVHPMRGPEAWLDGQLAPAVAAIPLRRQVAKSPAKATTETVKKGSGGHRGTHAAEKTTAKATTKSKAAEPVAEVARKVLSLARKLDRVRIVAISYDSLLAICEPVRSPGALTLAKVPDMVEEAEDGSLLFDRDRATPVYFHWRQLTSACAYLTTTPWFRRAFPSLVTGIADPKFQMAEPLLGGSIPSATLSPWGLTLVASEQGFQLLRANLLAPAVISPREIAELVTVALADDLTNRIDPESYRGDLVAPAHRIYRTGVTPSSAGYISPSQRLDLLTRPSILAGAVDKAWANNQP